MKKSTETNCQYLDRLRNERGQAASRDAIRSYGHSKGIKGMLSIKDQIAALESNSSTPRSVISTPVVKQPPIPTPVASTAPATSKAEPELFGRHRLAASIRAGFASTKVETLKIDNSGQELTGRDRLQSGIRSQLEKQGFTRSLSKV
jgi:hypothetical protein